MTTTIGPNTRVKVSSHVYARPFGEEVVLLEFARGEYFALDPIAAAIWKHLESGASLGAIAEEIAKGYEVSRAQALDDIVSLVRDMEARALVEAIAA